MRNRFHINSFALSLALKQRLEATRKWPILFCNQKVQFLWPPSLVILFSETYLEWRRNWRMPMILQLARRHSNFFYHQVQPTRGITYIYHVIHKAMLLCLALNTKQASDVWLLRDKWITSRKVSVYTLLWGLISVYQDISLHITNPARIGWPHHRGLQ